MLERRAERPSFFIEGEKKHAGSKKEAALRGFKL
jgi:hypothetical protein